ncbi:TPA: hypothetical protein ISB48_005128, partial [Escherichia coli]|nr:hypothetical protein [Escherichia coli]HBT6091089.1 hypothetical protein [Klebsiella pneumoniae]HAP1973044.1 hypothetical protein [Escherichia coli]HAP1977963.1 hypothetical protein [Escherichia coli]HAP1982907.1 hypothetical protein [Escherichia coli]
MKVELGVAAGCNQAATAGIRGLTLSGTKTHVKKSFFNIIEAFIRVIV